MLKNFLTKEVSIDVLGFFLNTTLLAIFITLAGNLSVVSTILISTTLFAFLVYNMVAQRKINTRNYNNLKNETYDEYNHLKSFTLEEIVNDKILISNYLVKFREVIKEKEEEGK